MRSTASFSVLVLVGLLGFVSTAAASFIDFRTGAYSAANGTNGYGFATADGVSATATAGPTGASISWEAGDGFGVNFLDTSGLKDEIDGIEYLTLSFSESVYVDQVLITDLFVEGFLGWRVETGSATTDSGTTWFKASGASSGELMLSLGQNITGITFRAASLVGHDFSVGGISAVRSALSASVPELDPNASGSAMALLLGGVACAMGRRRR